MTDRNDPHKVSLDVQVGQGGDELRVLSEVPFNICVLGDFSGRSHGALPPDVSSPILVDPDNVLTLAGMEPELRLTPLAEGDPTRVIRFAELEHFHPDHLVEALPLLRTLVQTRAQLADPTTFARAAAELEKGGEGSGEAPSGPTTEGTPPPGDKAALLDAVLDETSAGPPSVQDVVTTGIEAYVRQIVRPHLSAQGGRRQAEMLAGVDAVLGGEMCWLLHHPEFQRLEGVWRSVFSLVSRALQISDRIRVYLIDIGRTEIEDDLLVEGDLKESALFGLLAGEMGGAPDGSPWSVFVGLDSFGPDPSHVALMARIAELSALFGVSWISGAEIGSVAVKGPDLDLEAAHGGWAAEEWNAFRAMPEARSLGLSFPRVLLRVPYGEDSDPCLGFRFEEVGEGWSKEAYLWGDSAHLIALSLAKLACGRGGSTSDFDGFSHHVREVKGVSVVQPCVESLLDDDAVVALTQTGLTPIQGSKHREILRVPRVQSVARPAAPLSAWWLGSTAS